MSPREQYLDIISLNQPPDWRLTPQGTPKFATGSIVKEIALVTKEPLKGLEQNYWEYSWFWRWMHVCAVETV
jgi:hypothetical protein